MCIDNIDYKIVIVGDPMVGKTCIINRLVDDMFLADVEPTISPGLYKIHLKMKDSTPVTLNLWDTAGQEKFNCIVPIYARNSCGVFMVFDISNKQSIQNLEKWYDLVQAHVDNQCKFFVIGNKIDLASNNTIDMATDWALEHNFPIYFVSAKTGGRVRDAATEMAQAIFNERGKLVYHNPNVNEILDIELEKKSKCAC
ncbi:small GTP-binding protein, putative [Trichomonas vaginalis G3]|uniref:Small GTP-binding protein, putative n=1 Tax=Trichomonas vaginalis (strain ATCC PRA-98 / G3) TaxID=412133 RepID=A2DUM9_TRIV3|nr:GTPase protein [Trichomonas vaginalis G3]EAY15920.1 small GTP-binding protein, putative [Trichomonas vaginalis G3]KAI5506619.1 GTPase protein [Trichomonas vaginalis G3]|eukprot:XP_001328143.1 small GTP-binding protein [Trichomonas vaginalis G3]